jgi:hypothetical protein
MTTATTRSEPARIPLDPSPGLYRQPAPDRLR